MDDGIQLITPQQSGLTTDAKKADSKDSDDERNTFLMLMQLMFPTPKEFPQIKLDESNVEDKEDDAETPISDQTEVTELDGDDAARLALVLNWMSYGSTQGGGNTGAVDSDGQPINMDGTKKDISTLIKSGIDASQSNNMVDKQLNIEVASDIKADAKLATQTNQVTKQSQELPKIIDNINADLDIKTVSKNAQNTSVGLDKQSLADKLVTDLMGKPTPSQPVLREAGVLLSEAGNASVVNQAGSSANLTSAQIAQGTPKTFDLPTPVTHQDWSSQFSQQIVWLSQQQIKSAVIHLNPKEMGALEVNLKLDQNHAVIHMTTQHDGARDSIEQSLPRLREMMQDQGIQLGDVDVQTRQHEQSDQNQSQEGVGTASLDNNGLVGDQSNDSETKIVRVTKGLVDYFA